MTELFEQAVKTANEKKKSFEKIMSTQCFDVVLSEEEKKDPVMKSMLLRAKAMGGGFDIMKRVVEEQRTTKKKNHKNDYVSNGYGIVRKWQQSKQNKPNKETNPNSGDGFDEVRQIAKKPLPIKKKSLMQPLEVNPPKKQRRNYKKI